jgi:hypothetical protein
MSIDAIEASPQGDDVQSQDMLPSPQTLNPSTSLNPS